MTINFQIKTFLLAITLLLHGDCARAELRAWTNNSQAHKILGKTAVEWAEFLASCPDMERAWQAREAFTNFQWEASAATSRLEKIIQVEALEQNPFAGFSGKPTQPQSEWRAVRAAECLGFLGKHARGAS